MIERVKDTHYKKNYRESTKSKVFKISLDEQ